MTQTGWNLTPLHVADLPSQIEIPKDGLTLGRDAGNTVTVPASFPGVSSHHARLYFRDDRLFLEDLNSKNGTFVAGARVKEREIRSGDVFELGTGGPRFATMKPTGGGTETMFIPADQARAQRSIGNETIELVREKLGIENEGGVDQMLRKRTRRQVGLTSVLVAALIGAGAFAIIQLREKGEKDRADLQAQTDRLARDLSEQLKQAQAAIEGQRRQWQDKAAEVEAARVAYEEEKTRLNEQQAAIEKEIARLNAEEETEAEEIEALRSRLDETNKALDRFNPVELEKARLDRVSQVERAVVLIEASQLYRHEKTGETMYLFTESSGRITPNFDKRGEPFRVESTGSGFAVGPDGWILTNAHVVNKKEQESEEIRLSKEARLVPNLELSVVFSGESVRRPATLVRWVSRGDEDLALVKIEPFPEMPHLDELSLDVARPSRGSEVYLIGFPLGKRALQEGDKVIASTFKGIVSRQVGPFVQVDAAVHPGNSGGPLIDGEGRILGIVTAQAVGESGRTSTIGYIIPIAEAHKVWPPNN